MGEMSVTQSGGAEIPEVLQRFLGIMGTGRVYGPMKQEDADELVYRWKAGARSALESNAALLWPWLGSVKRAQAERVLSVLRSQPMLPRGNPAWSAHLHKCVRRDSKHFDAAPELSTCPRCAYEIARTAQRMVRRD